jgi:hypothetical protein
VNEGESVYDFCWYPYMSASGASIILCAFAMNFIFSVTLELNLQVIDGSLSGSLILRIG